jgi:acylphosphatase
MTAKHIIFKGRVQGVGFRYSSHRIAGQYEMTGYVRNLPDGTVEMLAQGPLIQIDSCIDAIQDYFGGHVRDCQAVEVPVDLRYSDFKIAY